MSFDQNITKRYSKIKLFKNIIEDNIYNQSANNQNHTPHKQTVTFKFCKFGIGQ